MSLAGRRRIGCGGQGIRQLGIRQLGLWLRLGLLPRLPLGLLLAQVGGLDVERLVAREQEVVGGGAQIAAEVPAQHVAQQRPHMLLELEDQARRGVRTQRFEVRVGASPACFTSPRAGHTGLISGRGYGAGRR